MGWNRSALNHSFFRLVNSSSTPKDVFIQSTPTYVYVITTCIAMTIAVLFLVGLITTCWCFKSRVKKFKMAGQTQIPTCKVVYEEVTLSRKGNGERIEVKSNEAYEEPTMRIRENAAYGVFM